MYITKGTRGTKGNGILVYCPQKTTNLESRPKSLCKILGTRKMCPQVVGVSIQTDNACRMAWRAKLGEIDQKIDCPNNDDLDQSVKSLWHIQWVEVGHKGGSR